MNARNAHLAALGLVRNPFPYTPDAGCYFSTPHLEEQVVELAHCITARKGISLLTAEVGMGKSTLVRRLMADLTSQQVVSALVFNTFLQGPELLAAVLQDFGLDSAGSMAADIHILNTFLLDNHRAGRTCLLIIDDAQNLSASSLELVRLLCNLETDQEKLLQILLAGQPELEDTLSQPSLRQLRSRLVKHARLHGLNSTEIADYVRFRFDSAGSDGTLTLHTDACQLLWRETQGVPRHVHLIMDRCLYGLAARQAKVIDADLMRQAVEDSRLHLASGLQDAPPVATPTQPAGTLRMLTYAVVLLGLLGAGVLGHQLGKNVVGMPAAQATVPPAAPQVAPAVP
ncbi:MAG: ExeA family protein, partial [Gammaproteobacteria bacterium]